MTVAIGFPPLESETPPVDYNLPMNNLWPILAFSQATLNSPVHYVTVQPVTAGYSDFFATYYRSQYDVDKYVRYIPGTLNLILTSTHDGGMRPASIPDRVAGCLVGNHCNYRHGCGSQNYVECGVDVQQDRYTYDLTTQVADEIESLFGKRPYVIYMELHRSKLDVNREVNEATCHVPEAIDAFNRFHEIVNDSKVSIDSRALLLDIHGQNHPTNWTELGYSIPGWALNTGNFSTKNSSIRLIGRLRCIVRSSDGNRISDSCFERMIRGRSPSGLGHYLSVEGYRVMPSPGEFQYPAQHAYDGGGYVLERHGSRYGGGVDAIHVGIPHTERYSKIRRDRFAKALARAVKIIMDVYYSAWLQWFGVSYENVGE